MSYNIIIEDLNITLVAQTTIINKYYNDLININNEIISIQDNINFIISNPINNLIKIII